MLPELCRVARSRPPSPAPPWPPALGEQVLLLARMTSVSHAASTYPLCLGHALTLLERAGACGAKRQSCDARSSAAVAFLRRKSSAGRDADRSEISAPARMPSCDCSPALLSDLRGTLSGAHSVASSIDRPSRSILPSLYDSILCTWVETSRLQNTAVLHVICCQYGKRRSVDYCTVYVAATALPEGRTVPCIH